MKKVIWRTLVWYCLVVPVVLSPMVGVQVFAQEHVEKVEGTVVQSSTAEPLPFVTVSVKNGTWRTQTNEKGAFQIDATKGTTLVFSLRGFAPREVVVGDGPLRVGLVESSENLDEGVVVGFGTRRRSDVTGAVQGANLEATRLAPNVNIIQSLQGTVPGLNVGQVNSAGQTTSIQVRGANTISGSTGVLLVLDGVMYNGSLASINPDDIASIDVLKDTSSTAIYGAQAGNGVMLITTKKGVAGKPKMTYSGSYATQTPSVGLPVEQRNVLGEDKGSELRQSFFGS